MERRHEAGTATAAPERITVAMERQRGQFVPPILHVRAPGGGGKIPLCPPAVVTRDGNALVLKNYAGHLYRYPDPEATLRVPVEPARL